MFHHRRILLCALVHGIHGLVDLLQPGRLLPRAFDNGDDVGVDLLDLLDDFLKSLAGFADQRNTAFHLFARGVDQCLDFLSGFGRSLGQFAHFLGNDSKALAGITGARCLHSRIQRQEVGLEGDIIDDADNVGDFP